MLSRDGYMYDDIFEWTRAEKKWEQRERLIQEQQRSNRLQEEYLGLLKLQEERESEREIELEKERDFYKDMYNNLNDENIDYEDYTLEEDKDIQLDRHYSIEDQVKQFNTKIPEFYKSYILATIYYLVKTNTKWLTEKLINQIFSKRNLSNLDIQNILKYLNEDLYITDDVGYFYGIGTDSRYSFERFYNRVNGQEYFEIQFVA